MPFAQLYDPPPSFSTCFRAVAVNDDFSKQSKSEAKEEAAKNQPLSERDLSQFDASADIKKIRGTWPGDESIDDILDALD